MEGRVLTGGGLLFHGLDWEKSAEAIVPFRNEPYGIDTEVSQEREGLNHKSLPISTGGFPIHRDQPLRKATGNKNVNRND